MNSRVVRSTLAFPLLLALSAMFLLGIPGHPASLRWVVFGLSVAGALVNLFSIQVAAFLLGMALCLVPLLGPSALSSFISFWLIGFEVKMLFRARRFNHEELPRKFALLGFLVLFLSIFAGAAQTFVLNTDFFILATSYQGGGLSGLFRYVLSNVREWRPLALLVCGNIICAPLLLSLARFDRRLILPEIFLGLATGAALSGLIFAAQYFDLAPFFSRTRNSFWIFTQRYSSSFSDPNSFGVMSALLVPLLFLLGTGKRRYIFWLGAVTLLVTVPWSGSRTFWLGLLLWLLFTIFRFVQSTGIKVSSGRFLALGICLLCLLLVLGYPPINNWIQHLTPLPGVNRVLKTVNWKDAGEMFSSRLIYSRIALAMWAKKPLVGVGLGRFIIKQGRVAESLGIELNGWRDNANNYYLHVLAEKGLIGLLLTFLSFYLFNLAASGRPVFDSDKRRGRFPKSWQVLQLCRISLSVFVVLLLTGPHLLFEEVRYLLVLILLAAVLNCSSYGEKHYERLKGLGYILIFVIPCVYIVALAFSGAGATTRGLYGREFSREDGYYSWTAKQAQLVFCPLGGAARTIEVRALNPDVTVAPVDVILGVSTEGGVSRAVPITLADSSWRSIPLEQSSEQRNQKMVVTLAVNRVWSPPGDPRWLGIIVKRPNYLCGGA